ncbi:MAG TPA: TonB-dependent receptor, partial [Burkholderiales bacterium]|nr:TonB-dependent receptor [Burkholderiales bacterium]
RAGLALEAALFRIDFDDQIVNGSSVGLPLQTFANAGKTLHQGFEIGWRAQIGDLIGAPGNGLYLLGAYTWLFDAKFDSDQISGGQNIKGNRLPYAPEHLLNASVGYEFPRGLDVRFGMEHVSKQYTDNLETGPGAANGRTGAISSYTLYNMTVNYETRRDGLSLFLVGNNLGDKTYIANRTDGIQIGRTRQIIGGVDWQF